MGQFRQDNCQEIKKSGKIQMPWSRARQVADGLGCEGKGGLMQVFHSSTEWETDKEKKFEYGRGFRWRVSYQELYFGIFKKIAANLY